jgi:uncharacterized membrane protein HdeD (DUF308 family)
LTEALRGPIIGARRGLRAGSQVRVGSSTFDQEGEQMAATLEADDMMADEAVRSPIPWWLFLVTGILWLIVSLVVLRFDITSIAAVGVLLGVVFAMATATEVVMAVSAPSWRWAHWILAILFGIGAIWAFFHPLDAFWELAAILGFLLLMKGSLDVTAGIMSRSYNDVWWLSLTTGIIEILLAFWVSQQFFQPRAALILVWVGFMALMRGISHIAVAFGVRRIERMRVA